MLIPMGYILKTLHITMGHLQQFVGDPFAVLTDSTDFSAGIDFLQVHIVIEPYLKDLSQVWDRLGRPGRCGSMEKNCKYSEF